MTLDLATGCARPVCLRVVSIRTGEVRHVLKRCNSRLRSTCESCSALVEGDARRIILDGVESAIRSENLLVHLTLTAPGFRATHTALGPCRCRSTHALDDDKVGLPVAGALTDFDALVEFNSYAGRLVSRTMDELSRVLGDGARLGYVAVADHQARGAIHFHVIIRAGRGAVLQQFTDRDDRERSRKIEEVVRSVATYTERDRRGTRIAWGTQVVAEVSDPTTDGGRRARRWARYIAKSITASGDEAVLGRNDERRPAVLAHHRHLSAAAAHARCSAHRSASVVEAGRDGDTCDKCRWMRRGQWGFAGHILRRSRDWSTNTLTSLRRNRAQFVALASGDRPDEWTIAEVDGTVTPVRRSESSKPDSGRPPP